MIHLLLVYILIPAAYIALAIWATVRAARAVKRPGLKATVACASVLFFVLLPTWDEIINRYHVNRLCAKDGGEHVYRVVKGVKGFYETSGIYTAQEAHRLGFEFVEGPTHGIVVRRTLGMNGKEIVNPIAEPSARYEFGQRLEHVIGEVQKAEIYVRDRITKDLVLVLREYQARRGWATTFLFGSSVRGITCESEDRRPFEAGKFIRAALQPDAPKANGEK